MAQQDQPWTILRLLNWTREYFAKGGVDEPRLAAEMLLAHVLKCKRIELYTRFELTPGQEKLAKFRELVARARKHEPVAYLVGEKEFYSLRFKVCPGVLIPRPETEILVSEAVTYLRVLGRTGRMWDACTGCGCVAVATASQVKDVAVLATDISPPAVEVAAENAAAHGLADRIRCRQADLLDLPEDCGEWAQLDVLTANPPYVGSADPVAEEVTHEPKIALYAGKDGLNAIRRLIAQAPARLLPQGKLIMEFGMGQVDDVCDLLDRIDVFYEPVILRDHQELERAVVATRKP